MNIRLHHHRRSIINTDERQPPRVADILENAMTQSDCNRLVTDITDCRKCKSPLARERVDPCISNESVEPRPIAPPFALQKILLVGQAPGLTEYKSRKPFQGPAGQGIRRILNDIGISDFDRAVYSTAIVKCFLAANVFEAGEKTMFHQRRWFATACHFCSDNTNASNHSWSLH